MSKTPKKGAVQAAASGLHFEVTTGLKRVLGRELITDDEVALFELVKNSFDAAATEVHLHFSENAIVVADNGRGMDFNDITEKWLQVAYSAKRGADGETQDYRDGVASRHYAGSKGIGRFSSDRLGSLLTLQTRPKAAPSGIVHKVVVDWQGFEQNDKDRFENIPVEYSTTAKFSAPTGVPLPKHGTIIEIGRLRVPWHRHDLLKLKSGLAKLINPFGADADRFKVIIHAPDELEADKAEEARAVSRREKTGDAAPANTANGDVRNFIFDTLREKTTFIEVKIVEGFIWTTLIDRNELIYKIKEPNPYEHLAGADFHCDLFYLNTSAKVTFTRRMGIQSTQFGSVFVFRNGFRVFPIGEFGDDWFGTDQRKAQGHSRYLGNREIIGKIDVVDTHGEFDEASSRNQGLIESPAVTQLRKAFRDHCLRRLERYVVPVSWADAEDRHKSDLTRIKTDQGRERVATAVASLVDNDDIELIDYNKDLIDLLDERSAQFETSISSLRAIAEKVGEHNLIRRINDAEKRFDELKRAQLNAERIADEERRLKLEAQARAAAAEAQSTAAKEELHEERKRNTFLMSVTALDHDTIVNLHHQITIYADQLGTGIQNLIKRIRMHDQIRPEELLDALERFALLNRRVMAVSKFTTKANFRLTSETIEGDVGDYLVEYVNGIAREFVTGGMRLEAETDGKGTSQRFKPMDIGIIVDNLISNARRARASIVKFSVSHPTKRVVHIRVKDNGRGIDKSIADHSRLFEKGFTTTSGSGLGLYHVAQVLGELNGSVEVEETSASGTTFLLRIAQ
ncbi:MAG TPA: ATP-binding protein [Hyphomonas sp.]|nr:ATP-binding protein [Hyphomonas sp.]